MQYKQVIFWYPTHPCAHTWHASFAQIPRCRRCLLAWPHTCVKGVRIYTPVCRVWKYTHNTMQYKTDDFLTPYTLRRCRDTGAADWHGCTPATGGHAARSLEAHDELLCCSVACVADAAWRVTSASRSAGRVATDLRECCGQVCCSVLQRVAACCSVLQRVAVWRVTSASRAARRVAADLRECCGQVCSPVPFKSLNNFYKDVYSRQETQGALLPTFKNSVGRCVAAWCSVVQCGAVWCSVVQCGECGAMWCSVVHCISAVCCRACNCCPFSRML